MPPSKSSKSKAAWDRARRYAAEHNVSVREARSILARQADEPDILSLPHQPQRRGATKQEKTADLAAAEQRLREKYPHVVKGSIQAHEEGPHRGRRTVEIACQTKGCRNRRRIHTSDAFQVKLCVACTHAHRKQRRAALLKKGKK